jgi:hypothetical protein
MPMQSLSFSPTLISNGWMESSSPSFPEKAGAGAAIYYALHNPTGSDLSLAVFPADAIIRFRVYDPAMRESRWLQIQIDADTDAIISKIVARQADLTAETTFGFYFSIASFEGVSILAWEQFEDDYR